MVVPLAVHSRQLACLAKVTRLKRGEAKGQRERCCGANLNMRRLVTLYIWSLLDCEHALL
jgi:hypothetical protein